MKFPNDPETEITYSAGLIYITQPDEECGNCGYGVRTIVSFSPTRALAIAKELIDLANKVESPEVGFFAFEKDKQNGSR